MSDPTDTQIRDALAAYRAHSDRPRKVAMAAALAAASIPADPPPEHEHEIAVLLDQIAGWTKMAQAEREARRVARAEVARLRAALGAARGAALDLTTVSEDLEAELSSAGHPEERVVAIIDAALGEVADTLRADALGAAVAISVPNEATARAVYESRRAADPETP